MGHHCSKCGRPVTAKCFRKGHVAACSECKTTFQTQRGCVIHPYTEGFNLEKRPQESGRVDGNSGESSRNGPTQDKDEVMALSDMAIGDEDEVVDSGAANSLEGDQTINEYENTTDYNQSEQDEAIQLTDPKVAETKRLKSSSSKGQSRVNTAPLKLGPKGGFNQEGVGTTKGEHFKKLRGKVAVAEAVALRRNKSDDGKEKKKKK